MRRRASRAGGLDWPGERPGRVLLLAAGLGVSYSVFSEWSDIMIAVAWAIRGIMPVAPVLDAGSTPPLQWMIGVALAYWAAIGLPLRRMFGAEKNRW